MHTTIGGWACVSCIDSCIAIFLPYRLVYRLGKKFWISHSLTAKVIVVVVQSTFNFFWRFSHCGEELPSFPPERSCQNRMNCQTGSSIDAPLYQQSVSGSRTGFLFFCHSLLFFPLTRITVSDNSSSPPFPAPPSPRGEAAERSGVYRSGDRVVKIMHSIAVFKKCCPVLKAVTNH